MVSNEQNDSQFWIPISDLMSGLMVIFIFIAIAFISKNSSCECGGKPCKDIVDSLKNITVGLDSTNKYLVSYDSVKKITANYKSTRKQIITAVQNDIGIQTLEKWNMKFDTIKLSFVFNDKNFEKGKINKWKPTTEFENSLDKLFLKLNSILLNHIDDIAEVKIEGFCNKDPQNSRYDELENTHKRGLEVYKIWVNKKGIYKGLSETESKKIFQKTKVTAVGATQLVNTDNSKGFIKNCNDDSCRRVEIVIKPKFEEVFINSIQK
jgi:hypothetical protein